VFVERDRRLGIEHDTVKEAFALALQAALALDQLEKVDELLTTVERLPQGRRPQFVNATVSRFRARFSARTETPEEADRLFKGAAGLFQELGVPFHLAVTRLEHAEWLGTLGRDDEARPLLAEARELFTGLKADPWLERTSGVAREAAAAPAGS
jgi:hypothetical protein